MGRQKLQKHIHKYHRVKNNVTGEKVWACGQADCYHFMPPHYVPMLAGKATICWHCGEVTVLDERNMELDKPVCFTCTPEGKMFKDVDIEEMQEILRKKALANEKDKDISLIGE